MKPRTQFSIGAVSALAVLSLLNGCSNDGRIAAPSAPLADGALLHGSIQQEIQLLGPIGPTLTQAAPARPFGARVLDGSASLPAAEGQPGSRFNIAVQARDARGPRLGSRPLIFIDSAGHRHELVTNSAGNDGPITRLRHLRDGQPILDVAYAWKRVEGGWLLSDRLFSVYQRGLPFLRHHLTVQSDVLAVAEPARHGRLGRSLTSGFKAAMLPAELEAAVMYGCWGEWLAYTAASASVVAATEAFTLQPYSPGMWSLLVTAISFWEGKLDALIRCQYQPIP